MFVSHSSLVMQDIKSESRLNLVKLCFIILTCISEDQYANALMSDPHLVFRVSVLFSNGQQTVFKKPVLNVSFYRYNSIVFQ